MLINRKQRNKTKKCFKLSSVKLEHVMSTPDGVKIKIKNKL